ncbi:MAG: hypothetical protein G01um101425_1024 [Candidatus Peregrinibacteria bacterium Gr01-1014_25]|nr:MAG: hypothetical protein G01um101425_1024 [Candidatus Peregrinibacteria bacterium Gr01-1014_25]
MQYIIPQQDKAAANNAFPLRMVSVIVVNVMLIPLLVADLVCSIYHAVYFRLNGMPLIPRKDYIVIDRGRLMKLNWAQRWACAYCDYANGLIAWIKAIINTTEIYSCAIKHASPRHNQEYQREYFPYEKFK